MFDLDPNSLTLIFDKMGYQYISVSVYIESSSEAVVSRLTDCPKIVLKDSKKSYKRFVCSLLLPPAKFANSLDQDDRPAFRRA